MSENLTGFTNYTMTKNWFFDEVLQNESLAVIKVIGYFIRNSIGRTNREGQRVEEVQASVEWLARKTNLDKKSVSKGLRIALEKSYLLLVKAGRPATRTMPGEGRYYRVNWDWSNSYVKPEEQASTKASLEDSEANGKSSPPSQTENFPLPLPIQAQGKFPPAQTKAPTAGKTSPTQAENFPIKAEENFPPCINKTKNHELNKLVEINAPTRSVSTFRSQSSSLISQLISDLTRDFGDNPLFIRSNTSRALNLWEKSDLSETEFVAQIYQARVKTLAGANIQRRRLTADGASSPLPNRMPYFFSVLSELAQPTPPPALLHPTTTPARPNLASIPSRPAPSPVVPALPKPKPVYPESPLVQDEETFEAKSTPEPAGPFVAIKSRLGWLPEAKLTAISQATLVPENSRMPKKFGLKFARDWHKSLFSEWELNRLGVELAAAQGEQPYILIVV